MLNNDICTKNKNDALLKHTLRVHGVCAAVHLHSCTGELSVSASEGSIVEGQALA